MLDVDNHDMALYDFNRFLRNFLNYDEGKKVRFKSFDKHKEIELDYDSILIASRMMKNKRIFNRVGFQF